MRHLLLPFILVLLLFSFTIASVRADEFGTRPGSLNAAYGLAYMEVKPKNEFTSRSDTGQVSIEVGRQLIPHFFLQFDLIGGMFKGWGDYRFRDLRETQAVLNYYTGMLGLGVKFYLFSSYFFQPFAEVGGLAGYQYLDWKDIDKRLGTSARAGDGDLMFGIYYGLGLDAVFTSRFGIRLYFRIQDIKGKKVETLDNSFIRIKSNNYYLGLITYFH